MLKASEAGVEDEQAKEDLEEEYAAAIMRDAEEVKLDEDGLSIAPSQVPSQAPSSVVAISNLQS